VTKSKSVSCKSQKKKRTFFREKTRYDENLVIKKRGMMNISKKNK
jgi:hypothetical protein